MKPLSVFRIQSIRTRRTSKNIYGVTFIEECQATYFGLSLHTEKFQAFMQLDEEELEATFEKARELTQHYFPKQIRFYAPSFLTYETDYHKPSRASFPSISITGSRCALGCKHCGGIVLNTMYPASSPGALVRLCKKLKRKGAVGCLISGGCLPDGSIPLERFIQAISRIKRELGFTIVIHTGIIERNIAAKLKEAGVDAALIDIIGSDETIKEIYNLDMHVGDYETSLRVLHENGIPTVPHVLVGIHYGQLKGELSALEMISRYEPSAVIVIAFMPIRRTLMESTVPPGPLDVAKVLLAARFKMPSTPLVLGCMRPKGQHRTKTDVLALKAGVNAIAFPTEDVIAYAKSLGYDISFSSRCCSQIFEDLRDGRIYAQRHDA